MRRAAGGGHLTCHLGMDSGHNQSRAIFSQWLRVSDPKLSRRREVLESGCRDRGGGRARVVQPCPGICLLLRLGQEWRHSCTARVPSQQISSLLQPDAGAATSSQPRQQIFKVLVRPRLSGCCTQHLVSAHLTLLPPPAAVSGDGSQHLGNINPSRYGLKQNIEFKKFSKCLSMR